MSRAQIIDQQSMIDELRHSLARFAEREADRLADVIGHGAVYHPETGEIVLTRKQTELEMGTPDAPARPFVAEAIRP